MNKSEFASQDYTAGKLNAVIKMLRKQGGSEDAPERFLRGELTVSEPIRSWREEDGVIYLSVTSDGTTGEEWTERLGSKGFRVKDYAKEVLRSSDFKPSNGITTKIAVLKGMLFETDDLVTKKIRAEAEKRNLTKPNAEVACLIREKFTDEEIEAMGIWGILTMHEPIKDSCSGPLLLDMLSHDDGGRWLDAFYASPDDRWHRVLGFAFAVSQVN